MKTKYFRFLFCGMNSCMVHFGEISDTLTKERFTFLYVRGAQKHETLQDRGNALFAYPKQVDLVVLGNANEQADNALSEILGMTEVRTLVVPKSRYVWKTDLSGVEKRIELPALEKDTGEANSLTVTAVNWRFFIKSYAGESITLVHGLESGTDLFHDISGEGKETEKHLLFDDCVMNVKVLDGERKCCCDGLPDGYACALGCALKKDYDICRYQNQQEKNHDLMGTLLCGAESDLSRVQKDLGIWMEKIRFFGIPTREQTDPMEGGENTERKTNWGEFAGKFKRYYIGLSEEISAETVSEICSSGLYQTPVILKEETGICCSGLLKYAE